MIELISTKGNNLNFNLEHVSHTWKEKLKVRFQELKKLKQNAI